MTREDVDAFMSSPLANGFSVAMIPTGYHSPIHWFYRQCTTCGFWLGGQLPLATVATLVHQPLIRFCSFLGSALMHVRFFFYFVPDAITL